MPKEFGRNRRVADLVQRELAGVLQRERDRLPAGLLTVSATHVTPDLSLARVFVTSLDTQIEHDRIVADLNSHAAHYRRELARRVRLKAIPRLEFVYDESVERGVRMVDLIESLSKDTESGGGAD